MHDRAVLQTAQGPIAGQCTTALYAFPLDAPTRQITIAGRRYWLEDGGSCGGVPPPHVHAPLSASGWERLDEHLALGYGRLGPDGRSVSATNSAGHVHALPTYRGYFLFVAADAGQPRSTRTVDLQILDAQGAVVARPFSNSLGLPLPSDAPMLGTALAAVVLEPGNIRLRPGKVTVVHRKPRAVAVFVFNSGEVTITQPVAIRVAIGGDVARGTIRGRFYPDAERTVRILLPHDVPTRTTVRIETLPMPGETNLANNRASFRLVVQP